MFIKGKVYSRDNEDWLYGIQLKKVLIRKWLSCLTLTWRLLLYRVNFFCSSEMVKAVLLEIINSKSLDLPYEIRNANDWFAQSEIGYFLDELEKMCNKLYTRFLMLAFTS